MRTLFICCFLILHTLFLFSQEKASIENQEVEFANGKLVVIYDLVEMSNHNTPFEIILKIEKEDGTKITPKTTIGDIGANVFAGTFKRIEWDFKQDSVDINEDIEVEIVVNEVAGTYVKNISMLNELFHSTIFPGWGIFNANGKKSAFFIGLAAYGMVFGAVGLNSSSNESYLLYKAEYRSIKKSDYHLSRAKKLRTFSRAFGVGAVVVWGINYWLTQKWVKDLKEEEKDLSANYLNRINVISNYDYKTQTQNIGFVYSF